MITENNPLTLLIVEDNAGDYELLKAYLQLTKLPVRNVFHAARMSEVPVLTDTNNIDIVLLDLSLPDSTDIDSVITLNRLLPKTPIVVLSGLSAIEIAMEAISLGAQDYLVKGEFDEKLLSKTIQYSIERKKIFENLQQSNERYEYVNKATLDTIWEYDFNSDTGKWGEGITLFGYSRDLAFNQSSLQQLIHPDDFERTSQHLIYCIDHKIENWQDEYRFRTGAGDYRDVYGRAYILFNNKGTPYRMFGAITDITERKRLEKELLAQQIEQQKLIIDVTIRAQEKERNELGKELHDNINQILATVKIYIGMVRNKKDPNDLVEKSYEYVNQAMEEIRKLSKTLVSPSLSGGSLKHSLEALVEEVNVNDTLYVSMRYEIEDDELIDDKKQLAIYRIIQEQITNIRKHSQAQKVIITVTTGNGNFVLSIDDNGVGFDTSKKAQGIGLQNISSRVGFYSGKMNIISEPGKGCRMEISVPLNN